MDCFQCGSEYDNEERLPRILTTCGHTLCQTCIDSSLLGNQLFCPQCSTVNAGDSVTKFPANLALLAVKTSICDLCDKHLKSLEAYCATDKSLLCISCILEDGHKAHEITSIAKAATKQMDVLGSLEAIASSNEQALLREQENIEKMAKILEKNFEKIQCEYREIFDFLRETLNSREEELMGRIAEAYNAEISYLEQRDNANSQYLSVISTFKHEKNTADAEDEISVVKYFEIRENLGKKACTRPTQLARSDPFCSFTREIEASFLVKTIKTAFTPSKSRPSLKQPLSKPKDPKSAPKPTEPTKAPTVNKKPAQVGKRKTLHLVSVNLAKEEKSPFPDWPDDLSSIQGHSDDEILSMKSIDLYSLYKEPLAHIYTIAGCADRSLTSVEKYDLSTDSWKPVRECLNYRTQFSAVALENEILIIGGKQGGKRVSSSELYDRRSDVWMSSSYSLTAPRCGFAAVAKLPKLYVMGGSDGVPLKHFEMWDEHGWVSLPSLKSRRDELAGCLGPDNRIYALGGNGGTDLTCLSTCEVFTSDQEKWGEVPAMESPKRGLACVPLPDGIYAIGGYDGTKFLRTLEKFEIRMQQWVPLTGMTHGRCTLSVVASLDCQYIYAIGGFNGTVLPVVERYSIFEDKWEEVCGLNQPRFMHCSVIFGN